MNTFNSTADLPARLDDAEVVYRLITRRRDIEDDGNIKVTAFFRMPDEDGLSVQVASLCVWDENGDIKEFPLKGVKKLGRLVTQQIRTIKGIADAVPTYLDVILRPELYPSEAEIVNVPIGSVPELYVSGSFESDELAVRIAVALAAICKPEPVKRHTA